MIKILSFEQRRILSFLIFILVFAILGIFMVIGANLPTVGGDTDNWGTVLNNFLQTEHNANGSHANITATGINIEHSSSYPYLNISNGSSTIFMVDSDGNIGIGTNSPLNTTHINGTFYVQNTSGSAGLIITKDNKVGIGTTSPGAELEVSGQTAIFGTGAAGEQNVYHRYETYRDLAPFAVTVAGSTTNEVFNDVFYWGYNARNGGTKIVSDVPHLIFSLETDYYNGGVHGMEWNLDYQNANQSKTTRPLAFFVERENLDNMYWWYKIGDKGDSKFVVTNTSESEFFRVDFTGGDRGSIYAGNLLLTRTDNSPAIQVQSSSLPLRIVTGGITQWYFEEDGVLKFGNAGDTNLYSPAANTLKTDDTFITGANTTAVTCNSTYAGGIIYSGGKHYGCNGSDWNAFY